VLGIVENMSYFECPHCGKPSSIFGAGGGERLAREVDLPLLAQIPLDPRIVEGGDTGRPLVVAEPASSAAKALVGLSERVVAAMATLRAPGAAPAMAAAAAPAAAPA
jgi:ATP-binding protein involved in chromosome partitioning